MLPWGMPHVIGLVSDLCCYLIYNTYTTQHCLSCINAAHAITYMNELTMLAYNLWLRCLR